MTEPRDENVGEGGDGTDPTLPEEAQREPREVPQEEDEE